MFWHFDIRLGIVVVVAALIQGGRYERLVALLFAVRGALNLLAPKWDWLDPSDWYRLLTFQSIFLLILLWLVWRHRRGWLVTIVLLQAASVGLEGWCALHVTAEHEQTYMGVFFTLAVAKSLALAWAVIQHWIAPPRPLPGANDPDLYEEARKRGALP